MTTISPAPPSGVRRRAWPRVVGRYALVLVSGWGACALALPEDRAPALVLAGLGALAVVAALATGWRIVGSVAVVLVAAAPLMSGALEDDAVSAGRLVAATLLVLLLVIGLDGVEAQHRQRGWSSSGVPAPVVLIRSSPLRRLAPPLAALGSCAVLGTVLATTVTPSVAFVVLGVLAAVGAVVAATRVH